jgi:hypothetical protein
MVHCGNLGVETKNNKTKKDIGNRSLRERKREERDRER